jgi:hypothetical protein
MNYYSYEYTRRIEYSLEISEYEEFRIYPYLLSRVNIIDKKGYLKEEIDE